MFCTADHCQPCFFSKGALLKVEGSCILPPRVEMTTYCGHLRTVDIYCNALDCITARSHILMAARDRKVGELTDRMESEAHSWRPRDSLVSSPAG
jgi:hypothetical protein